MVLIFPPSGQPQPAVSLPIGILSLASFLKSNHIQPIIIDFDYLTKFKDFKIDRFFFKRAAKFLMSYNVNILGFSCINNTLPASIIIARECKKINPEVKIILGGPEVSFEGKKLLSTFPELDMIVRGEGELTLLELLNALHNGKELKNILGLAFKEDDKIIENPDRPLIEDLDSLPFLDIKLLPDRHKYHGIAVEGGRGCPYQCAFCCTSKMWRRRFRIKSPQRMANELKYMNKSFGSSARHPIAIHHDNFLVNNKIAKIFLSKLFKGGIIWFCSSRLDHLNTQLIKCLKKAGCRFVFIGIETASLRIQRKIKKIIDLTRLPFLLKAFSKYKLSVVLSYIIGFPSENIDDINQTLLCALKQSLNNAVIRIYPLIPLKGSLIYLRHKNLIDKRPASFHVMTPPSTGLPEEISLIKKHPLLFPSFYYYRSKIFPQTILYKTCCLFNFLADYFPATTLKILSVFSITPLQLSKFLVETFEKEDINWIFPYELNFWRCYLPYFNDFIRIKCPDAVRFIYQREISNRHKHSINGDKLLSKNELKYYLEYPND